MKKGWFIWLLWVGLLPAALAQPPDRPPGKGPGGYNRPDSAMVEAVKIAFVTKRLQLTPDEAQRFWPTYNKYIDEMRKTRREYRKDELEFEEKALEIRKRYREEFRKILGEERVTQIYNVDREFRDMIRKELQERQRMRQGGNGQRK